MNLARHVSGIQKRASAFLTDRCTLWREADDVTDAFGLRTEPEWVVIQHNVPCRVYGTFKRISETVRVVGDQEVRRDETLVALSRDTDVSEVERLTIDGAHYMVKQKPNRLTDAIFHTLVVERSG